jgi:glycosyltransferase 2 family protein
VKRALALGRRFFTPIALVGTLAGVGLALWSQRAAIGAFDWTLAPGTLAAAVALFAVPPVLQGVSFWIILRRLGVPTPLRAGMHVWMRSFAVRYAPSGALAFVLRIREQKRLAATRGHIWTASAYEQLVALTSGAIACVVAFAAVQTRPPLPALAIATAAIGVGIALRPGFLGGWVQGVLARRGVEIPAILRGRELAAVVALNAAGWLATGAAAWLLVDALTAGDPPSLGWLIGVYAFAWLLGFVVPLLPGGLGLRDGTLAAFLATAFGAGPAAAVAVALRFANTIGELVAVGATELVYAAVRRLPDQRPNRWTLPAARASCSQNQRRSR